MTYLETRFIYPKKKTYKRTTKLEFSDFYLIKNMYTQYGYKSIYMRLSIYKRRNKNSLNRNMKKMFNNNTN